MKTRILVVDDEPDFTSLLKMSLEAAGYYEVREENDATCAVSAAREFGPDLIVLDVMMPDLDGSEVAALVRRDVLVRDTPLVFLTALICESDAPRGAYTSGGNTFLPKSLPLPKLLDCIEATLRDSRTAALSF
jgi:two-component system OmpR family response regulator